MINGAYERLEVSNICIDMLVNRECRLFKYNQLNVYLHVSYGICRSDIGKIVYLSTFWGTGSWFTYNSNMINHNSALSNQSMFLRNMKLNETILLVWIM